MACFLLSISSEKLKEIDFDLKNENFRKSKQITLFFQEVAKDNNNNKVGVASNSNAKHLLTIMVAVMAAAAGGATGTTKDNNNKEEVTLAVRIGADFVKISFINS